MIGEFGVVVLGAEVYGLVNAASEDEHNVLKSLEAVVALVVGYEV